MLHLVFQAGGASFALPADVIRRVLPLVRLTPVVRPVGGVVGVADVGGVPVTVVDLALVLSGRPCRPSLSTRIVLMERAHGGDGPGGASPSGVAMMVEKAYDTRRFNDAERYEVGAELALPSFVTSLINLGQGGVVHLIDPQRLLAVVRGWGLQVEPPGEVAPCL